MKKCNKEYRDWKTICNLTKSWLQKLSNSFVKFVQQPTK